MTKLSQKRRLAIAALTSKFPFLIKHPELLGLRLKEGATVAIVIKDNDGDRFSVGLKFNGSGHEHAIFFSEPVHQSWLPSLSSPGCVVSLDLDGDDIGLYILTDRLQIDSMTPLATLAGFLEEFDDSQPDVERFKSCAKQ